VGDGVNCFEWNNRVSDYLDGTLIGPLKKEADDHAESCPDCGARHGRYRTILDSIAAQPRSTLPVPIRKAPLSASIPRLELHSRRSRWDRLPWFIRTSVEGLGVAGAILVVVALVPKIRAVYEQNMERRLDLLIQHEANLEAEVSKEAAAVPLARSKATTANPADDEYAGEDEEDAPAAADDAAVTGTDAEGQPVRVGNAEIWRFNLKTDSPRETRPRIVQTLADLKISADTPGFGGIEAPGGIQFDLLVSKAVVPGLKASLQKLGNQYKAAQAAEKSITDTFTWYRNKSKKAIPAGKARVVIWLSQM
jgi:hypothetical protein